MPDASDKEVSELTKSDVSVQNRFTPIQAKGAANRDPSKPRPSIKKKSGRIERAIRNINAEVSELLPQLKARHLKGIPLTTSEDKKFNEDFTSQLKITLDEFGEHGADTPRFIHFENDGTLDAPTTMTKHSAESKNPMA